MTARRVCKDCKAEGIPLTRPANRPGPRCATHHRERKKMLSTKRWEQHIQKTYGITPSEYWAIYEAQGGVCAICQRATGARKRLSIDHDHSCCSGKTSCGRCVRSLLCTPCNNMLGHGRDDYEFFRRAADYLEHPIGKEVLWKLRHAA